MKKLVDLIHEELEEVTVEMTPKNFEDLIKYNKEEGNIVWKTIREELNWSEVKEDDIEVISKEDAIKMIYKRSGDEEYLLWFDNEGNLMMRSRGLMFICVCDKCKTIRKAYKTLDIYPFVYMVKDYNRFSTVELRNKRRAQKLGNNILNKALEDIRNGYELFANTVNDDIKKKYLHLDVVTRLENTMRCLEENITCAKSDENFLSATKSWKERFEEMINEYNALIDNLSQDVTDNNTGNNRNAKDMIDTINTFECKMDKFFAPYKNC